MYGTCQHPLGGKSVQKKLLQVPVMATSGVSVSQHRPTSNFLCLVFSLPFQETRLEGRRGGQLRRSVEVILEQRKLDFPKVFQRELNIVFA